MKKYTLPVNCKKKKCTEFGKCPQIKAEVHSLNNGKVHILFFGQGGGKEEEEQRLPFVGVAGEVVRNVLKHIKSDIGRPFGYGLDNIIRCFPDKHKPTENQIHNCLPNLIEDIERLKPQVLVPFGNYAIKSIYPDIEYKSITSISGKLFNIEINGKKYKMVPCIHPSYVHRNKGDKVILNKFRTSIISALKETSLAKKINIKSEAKNIETKYSKLGEYVLLIKKLKNI